MIRFKDVEILNRHRFTERNKESKAFPNKWGCIKKNCIPLKGNCLYLYTPMASYGILSCASTPPPSSPQRWYDETLAEGWRGWRPSNRLP